MRKLVPIVAAVAVTLSLAACDFRASGQVECKTDAAGVTSCTGTGQGTPLTPTPPPTATRVPTATPTRVPPTTPPVHPTTPPVTTNPPPAVERAYFTAADWLWNPIPATPRLDGQSSAMGGALGQGKHVADIIEYGVTLRGPSGVTSSTPRFDVTFSEQGNWGPDPFGSDRMPIPDGVPLPTGGDSHLSVADPVNGQVYSLWMARKSGSGWSAGWGGRASLAGDGREVGGGSTGSGISRFAAVVRAAEIRSGVIPHALFFSTDIARKKDLRYPAIKTDGSNDSGSGVTIPEGARVQLDPSIDLTRIPGITPGELAVGRALQTYGAYVGDNGGARMAFIFEYIGSNASHNTVYSDAGISGDYYGFPHLPWNRLRVLAQWDGR